MTTKMEYKMDKQHVRIRLNSTAHMKIQASDFTMKQIVESAMVKFINGEKTLPTADSTVPTSIRVGKPIEEAFRALAVKHNLSFDEAVRIAVNSEVTELNL